MAALNDRLVLVTGATSGLGRSCVGRLAADGARLILAGRSRIALDELARAYADRIHSTHVCDLSEEAQIKALVTELRASAKSIAGWVLAAGIQEVRPLMMETATSLLATWAVNVQGTLALLAAALKARLMEKGGSVVLFSSAAAVVGGPGLVSYAASKGALEAAARSLAMELAPQGIRVNAVAPGVIPTPMSEKYFTRLTAAQIDHLKAEHPLGFGKPEDVAGPVAFLISDDARWITGTVITMDGGLSAH